MVWGGGEAIYIKQEKKNYFKYRSMAQISVVFNLQWNIKPDTRSVSLLLQWFPYCYTSRAPRPVYWTAHPAYWAAQSTTDVALS